MGRLVSCVLGLVALLASAGVVSGGCGGEGGGDELAHAENVRATLTTILVAAASEDLAAAAPHLGVKEYAGVNTEGKPRPFETLTPQEKADLTTTCFRQTLVVPNQTTLRDAPTIAAALAAGRTTVHPRISKAEVAFDGPRSEGAGGPLHFVANFTLGLDNRWRLVTLDMKFR